jgi:hypothetical protein
MFSVTGTTGKVRGVVARVLLAPGLDARGVVRDPVKGEDWANQGCEVVVAEMNDAVALARAFDAAQAVFILLPPTFDPTPGFPEARAAIAALSDVLTISIPKRVAYPRSRGSQCRVACASVNYRLTIKRRLDGTRAMQFAGDINDKSSFKK